MFNTSRMHNINENISLVKGSDVLEVNIQSSETVCDSKGHFTMYGLKIRNKINANEWMVFRRFSRFLSLLPKHNVTSEILRNGISPHVVENRKIFIMNLISNLLDQPVACLSESIRNLLRIPENVCMEVSSESTVVYSGNTKWNPPSDEAGEILPWLISEWKNLIFRDNLLLVKSVAKLNESTLNEFIRYVTAQIDSNSIVDSTEGLSLLYLIVSVETNWDNACVIHAISKLSIFPDLTRFVANPTAASSRLTAFQLINQTGLAADRFLHESVVGEYFAWLQSDVSTYKRANFGGDAAPEGLAGVFALGPHSPMASSPSFSKQTALSQACSEARDFISFTLMNRNSAILSFQGSSRALEAEWKHVVVPHDCDIRGEIRLMFRVPKEGDYEIMLDWTLDETCDLEKLVSVLWDGYGELGVREEDIDVIEGEVPIRTSKLIFNDQRRPGGTAEVRIVKSKTYNTLTDNILVAITADPRSFVWKEDPLVRIIRHIHIAGCEVNYREKKLHATARLSSNTIFLVAGDLLGEKLFFWTALEKLSHII